MYRRGDAYLPEALDRLDQYLRDYRTGDVHHYDPRVFDLLHELTASLGRPSEEIDVICGYRTPRTNEFLRTRSPHTGVAEHSLHMQAEAIDIRLPGVSTAQLRDAASDCIGAGLATTALLILSTSTLAGSGAGRDFEVYPLAPDLLEWWGFSQNTPKIVEE